MYKYLLFFLITNSLFFSCKNGNEGYVLITNHELKEQLAFYVDSLNDVHKGEEYVIRVYYRNVNDSVTRYTISDEIDYNIWYECAYNFKSKIKEKDILFVMYSATPMSLQSKTPFFKFDEKRFAEEAKKYFPKIYQKYGLTTYRTSEIIYEPELIHLTFLRDKLIGKCRRRGMPGDNVPVNMNDTIVYL